MHLVGLGEGKGMLDDLLYGDSVAFDGEYLERGSFVGGRKTWMPEED